MAGMLYARLVRMDACERAGADITPDIYLMEAAFPGGAKKEKEVSEMSFFVETASLEMHGPYSADQLLAMYRAGAISIFSLVRVVEVRPVEYRFFGEILLEIEPKEVEKGEPEPPKTLEVYRPLHAELRYGHTPEFLSTTEQRKEDIQRFLARKAAGFSGER